MQLAGILRLNNRARPSCVLRVGTARALRSMTGNAVVYKTMNYDDDDNLSMLKKMSHAEFQVLRRNLGVLQRRIAADGHEPLNFSSDVV